MYLTQADHFSLMHDSHPYETISTEAKYICDDILKRLPLAGELKAPPGKHPLGMILKREVKRFNGLLELIRQSLSDVKRAINGMAIADIHFSKTLAEITDNKVPTIWLNRSYLTMKTLSSYIDDLSKRIEFFQTWSRLGVPNAFWFSAFYFPQSLITTAKQLYGKQYDLDFDDVGITVELISFESNQSDEFETFMKVYVITFHCKV